MRIGTVTTGPRQPGFNRGFLAFIGEALSGRIVIPDFPAGIVSAQHEKAGKQGPEWAGKKNSRYEKKGRR